MRILDASSKTPLYQELYYKLREKIEGGEYAVGSRLPSEKEISEENGVSRITSKHALEQLVNEGFIKRFPGKGTFVQSATGNIQLQPMAPVMASSSGSGSSQKLIGVVMEGLSADFGGEVLLGIERKCAELGYSAIIKFSRGDEERENACINELIAAGAKGIVLMCVYKEVYSPAIMKLSLEGFPMVFMDRCLKGLPIPFVGTDHLEASRQLTNALLEQGHTHLALAMFDESHNTSSAEDRTNGYVESCLKHNLLCSSQRIFINRENIYHAVPEERAENVRKVRAFLQENPETTAIVALSARVGMIVLEAVEGTNVKVVAGFDGPQNAFQTPCELMYVVQNQMLMGSTACEQLIDRINGREVPHVTYIPYQMRK